MIPILYEKTETTFTSNGLCRLPDATKCEVTEERNGQFELYMEYPVDGKNYKEIQTGRFIAATHDETRTAQPFEIYNVSSPLEGVIQVRAWHISYKLNNIILNPFTATSCSNALAAIPTNSINTNPFTFWTNKSVSGAFKLEVPKSVRAILGGTQGSILDTYGTGEYEFDKFAVKLWVNRGTNSGASLRYGKNLTSLEQELSAENQFDSIVPYWEKDGTVVRLDHAVVRTGGTANKTIVMDLSGDFEEAPTTAQLEARAQTIIDNSDNYMVRENITLDFVALWQTEEYKDIANLERIHLCDTVNIFYEKLGINATAKCIKVVYDTLRERYISLELGEPRTTLAQQIQQDIVQNVTSELPSQGDVAAAIEKATALLTGADGGYHVQLSDADGHPTDDLWMDTDDVNTAVNVLRINKNGIGFSTSGINGPYTSAWLIDGSFNADFITAGTLSADRIGAGSIAIGKLDNAAQAALMTSSSSKIQYYLSTSSSSATGGSWADTVPTWSSGKYIWTRVSTTKTFADSTTSTTTTTAVYDKALTTALSTAASADTAASNAQTTADGANSREQLIYRSSSGTAPSATTTWVTDATGGQNKWTTVRPQYSTTYPNLYVATQRQTVAQAANSGTTCSCTTPKLDETTTVIDGGHITTGTIDANLIRAGVLQDTAGKNSWNLTTGALTTTSLEATGYVYLNGGTGSYLNIPLSSTNPTNRYFRIEAPANYGDPFVIIRSDGEASSSSYGELTVSPGEIEWTDTDTKMLLTGHALTFSGGYSVGNSAVELGQLQGLRIYNRQGDSTSLHNDSINTTGTLSVGGATTLTGNLTVSGETNLTGNLGLSGAVAPFSFSNGTTSGPVLTLGTSTVTVPSASSSQSGVVTTGAQTFEGQKTFAKNPLVGTGTEAVDRFIQVRSNSGNITLESVGNANGDSNRGVWLGAHGTATSGKWAIRVDTDNNVFLGTHSVTGELTLNYGAQYTLLYFKPTTAVDDYTYGLFGLNVGSSTTPTQSRFYFQEESVSTADGATTGYKELYYLPASDSNRTTDATYNILTSKTRAFAAEQRVTIPANGSVTLTFTAYTRAVIFANGYSNNVQNVFIVTAASSSLVRKALGTSSQLTVTSSGLTMTVASTNASSAYLDIVVSSGTVTAS